MIAIRKVIRANGTAWHSLISKSRFLSHIYIRLLSFLIKPFELNVIKFRLINSINTVNWQVLNLPPQYVCLGNSIKLKIFPHFQEFDLQSLLFENIPYEREVFACLETYFPDHDCVIEIGANIGIFTLFFYKAMITAQKKPRIYAFEPSKEAYRRLLKNIEINQANAIETYNCAIGNQTQFADFFEPEGHLTNGSLSPEFATMFSSEIIGSKALVIDGSLLKSLVKKNDRIFLKIDVEGFEFEVLSSMKEFIVDHEPTIVLEVLKDYKDKLNLLSFLGDKYNFYNITNSGLAQYPEFQATEHRDYILLPKKLEDVGTGP
jgi:FkbM family methyltransferase